MADNFSILLDANLDTSKIPQELKNLNAQLVKSTSNKIKIAVGIDKESGETLYNDGLKIINTFKDKANNIFKEIKFENLETGKVESSFERVTSSIKTLTTETKKFTDSSGALNTWTTTIDNLGQVVQTQTRQYTEFGKSIKETSTWVKDSNGDMVQVGDTVKTISEDLTQFENIVTNTSKSVSKYKTNLGATVTVIKEVTKSGEKLKTVITEEATAQGELTKTIEVYNEATGGLISKHKEVINDQIKLREEQEKLQKSLVETSKTTNKVRQDSGEIVTTIEEVNKSGEKIFTTITQIDNGLGTLITKTEKYKEVENEEGQIEKQILDLHTETLNDQVKIIDAIKERTKAQEKLNEITIKSETSTKKGKIIDWDSGKEYKGLITTIKSIDKEGKETTKTIEKFTDAEGRLVEQTQTLDNAQQKVAHNTRTVSDGFKETANSAQKATKETRTFGQALGDAISRLAKYYIASLPIQMVRKGIQEAITTIKNFDSALIEFRKVSDLAGESLTNYVAKLAEMGEITGSTMQAMVEASTEFRKSGFSDADSAKLASIAEMYRNIADEEISAADSASFIIAQMKAFNIEADQAEHIIDAVNEVANNFSVSSADLAQNLGNMSAIMAINNVTMEEQIGMLTGVTEITRNASSASRGLVMISSRLTQVLDDTSSTGKKLTAIYDSLNIALKNEDGQLRSHTEILGDLAGKWDTLSENEQKYIALTSAGARQQQNFVSLMENWSQVAKATATAYNSMGSAQKENAKVMDSIEKKVEVLRSQFQQLVIGKGGLQDVAKKFLDIGVAILKFANSDVGKVIIQIVAMESAIALVSKGLNTFSTKLIENAGALVAEGLAAKGWTDAQIKARVAEIGFTEAVELNTAALIDNAIAFATSPIGVVAITLAAVAAITIANTKAMEKYNRRLEDANKQLTELSENADNVKSDLDKLKDSLKAIQEQIKNNNETKLKIHDKETLETLDKENDKLKKQEENLKRQITLQERKLELAQQEASEQAKTTLGTTVSSKFKKTEMVDSFSGAGTGEYIGVEVTPEKELQLAIDKYKELKQTAKDLQDQLDKTDSNTEEWQNLNSQLEQTQSEMDDVESRGLEMSEIITNAADNLINVDEEYKNSLYGLVDSLYETTGAERELNDEQEKTLEDYEKEAEEAKELAESVEKLADSLGVTATELEGLRERFDDLTLENFLSQLQEARQIISDTSTVIDNLQESLEAASKAQEEYNENGYLTLDTFQSLIGISAQYLAALVNENGQLEINQTTLGNLVEELRIAKIEELQHAAAMEIAANHTDDAKTASINAEGAVSSIGNTIENTGNKALTAAGHVATFAASVASLSGVSQKDWTAKDRETVNRYKDLASQIAKIEINTTRAGNAASSAGKKGAGAAKQAKDATKELNKELEETKKNYEKVIKWISKQYDKEIDKIKKAEKEALKAEEAKIKAKEKEKDNALDAIEKEIDALEKEKDARKKYWDDQIDALKKSNEALKDSLELQEKLDALEKARNTKVKIYKEGQGFVYDVDQTAVAKAQKELDEYLSEKAYEDELERLEALRDAEMDNYEQRLDALNDYKDNVQESYEKQIEALNEHKEQLEAQYEAEIEIYENYKQQFEDMVNAYEEEQNRLLAQQLTHIDFENKNWMTRLDNLAAFVNEYNKLQKQLDTGNTSVSNTANLQGGGGLPKGSSKNTGDKTTTTKSNYDDKGYKLNTNVAYLPTSVTNAIYGNKKTIGVGSGVYRYAKGTSSIKQDQIAIVGENPNQEIVIGSKINNGELMNLGKGTGVVNADSSKTLAGMLNQVGQFGSSGFGSGNGTLNNNINNDSLVVNGVTIQGANIKDPETFVNGLLNLKAEALQRAYRHR